MSEEFLYYIWQYQLFDRSDLTTSSGEELEIIKPGTSNSDAGPDFFNAKVKIAGTLWAGNIEIHVNASDWLMHGHGSDSAYNNVILQDRKSVV